MEIKVKFPYFNLRKKWDDFAHLVHSVQKRYNKALQLQEFLIKWNQFSQP